MAGIVAAVGFDNARISRNATGLCGIGGVFFSPEIRGPLPDISDHIVNAVTVGGVMLDPRR